MLNNEQTVAKAIMEQEKNDRAPVMKDDEYFELFAAQLIMKKYDLDDNEIDDGLTDGGNDGGCDGIYLFVNGEYLQDEEIDVTKYKRGVNIELHIIQCKNTTGFSENTIMKWKTLTENVLNLESDYTEFRARYSDLVLSKMDVFRKIYLNLIRKSPNLSICYHYATFSSEIHPNLQAQAEELKTIAKGLYPSADVEVDFVTAGKLNDLFNEHENSEHLLICKEVMNASEEQEYVVLTTLPKYYEFITDRDGKLIRHIFEYNVRDYQGKVTVNAQIKETLEYGTEKEDFWWLNNGVTILAKEVRQQSGKHLLLSEPEIVNGLQSSNEIYAYFSRDISRLKSDKRSLLVRIIVPKSEESRDHIILATNSQTQIPKASLRATDIIHRNIEQYFKSKGLYYDRRKNYYKNLGMPIDKIISISFLGQCLMATLLQQPDYARARPSTLLEKDATYKKLFSPKTNLQCYYIIAFIGKYVCDAIKHEQKYSASEKTNIQFGTVFYYTSTLVKSTKITSSDIEKIDLSAINTDNVIACADQVLGQYRALGGTDKIAKNSDFTRALIQAFNEGKHVQADE